MVATGPHARVQELSRARPGSPAVIFACAADRRTALAPAVATLMRYGYQVELVYGLQAKPEALERLAFERRGTALYILCGGPEIADDALAEMHDSISDQGVPPERVWSGQVDWNDPVTILDEVAQRLGGVDRSTKKTTVVGPPPLPTPPDAPIPSIGTAVMPAPDDSVVDGAAFGLGWRRLSGNKRWYVAAGVAATLGLFALVAMSGDDDAEEDTKTAANDVAKDAPKNDAPASAPAEPEPAEAEPAEATPAEPGPEPEPAEAEPAIDDEAPQAAIEAEPEPTPEPEPQVADDDADEGEDEDAPAIESTLTDEELRAEQDTIYTALSDQQIRSIDILLVAPLAVEVKKSKRRTRTKILKFNFEKAQTYCEELVVHGVGRWRLPTIGELVSLSKVGWLDKTMYWSQTRADTFGSARLVWNNRSARMGPVPQRWRDGRVTCVRYTRPEVEGEPDISAP